MNWLNTILILAVAFLAIFLEATFDGARNLLGAQIDLLPGLMVYAGLNLGLTAVAVVAVASGFCFDALSANPFGVSVLPLFLVGWIVHFKQHLILREQAFAQFILGLGASAFAPLVTLLISLNGEVPPLIGLGTLWQWLVMTIGGALFTPLYFWFFGRVHRALNYQPLNQSTFRPDREIKRGRS